MELAERTAILEREIVYYSRLGYRIQSQTTTTAQLIRPRTFSCLMATLWLIFFLVGLLIYLFWYLSKRDDIVFLSVDENGRLHRTLPWTTSRIVGWMLVQLWRGLAALGRTTGRLLAWPFKRASARRS